MGVTVESIKNFAEKYSISGPRYTSYPTAPQWLEEVNAEKYQKRLHEVKEVNPLSLYVHLPFCEALCYYCGCNIQITKDKTRPYSYVTALIREMEKVSEALPTRGELSQIAWGGGTPTFLPVSEIIRLYEGIKKYFDIASQAEISIEIDPCVTTLEQLQTLRNLGFNRVSLGLQDFNPVVQKAVNRIQSEELTENFLRDCRRLGFSGINIDLIYGLPYQTLESFEKTIDSIIHIQPDRIALYNYAHLPSLRPHQKILEKMPRPEAQERLEIFTKAFDQLTRAGYVSIGMDHFALPEDELTIALNQGTLYRNFMGYTVKRGAGMIGIGASSIGEMGGSYYQNIREAKKYEESVEKTGFAVFRSCTLSQEDKERQWVIQNLMCRLELLFEDFKNIFKINFGDRFSSELDQLKLFEKEGMLQIDTKGIHITELGRLFARNLAMAFDAYLSKSTEATYSKTV